MNPLDAESMTQLRVAAYTADPAAVAAALDKRDLSLVLQQAGAAVLAAYERNPGPLAEHATSLVNELTDRGLPGDEELAALLRTVLKSEPLPDRTLPVDLEMLAELLEGDPSANEGGYVDLVTGEVLPAALTDEAMVGDAYVDIEEEPDRWLHVSCEGSRESWRDMQAYVDLVSDPRLQERLLRSIEGRGAFRRFRNLLAEADDLGRWRQFSNDRRLGRAREFLALEGISAA